jgi:hypothetical protein
MEPFFILGAQRSGTTLLRLILNAHPDVAIPQEGTFWMPLLRDLRADFGAAIPPGRLRSYLRYLQKNDQFLTWGLPRDGLLNAFAGRTGVKLADLMAFAYGAFARQHGKPHWGDKTPSFFRNVPDLVRLFPQARFLYVVRDGRDVYLSTRKMLTGRGNLPVAALEWRHKNLRLERDLARCAADRHVRLRHEDLLSRPDETLRGLCRFLGLEYSDRMLEFHRRSHEFTDRHHSDLIFKPLDPSAQGRWRSALKPSDAAAFEVFAGDVLARNGYPLSTARPAADIRLKAWLRLLAGLPRRGAQVASVAARLKIASLFGWSTQAAGGRIHRHNEISVIAPAGQNGDSSAARLCQGLSMLGRRVTLYGSEPVSPACADGRLTVKLTFRPPARGRHPVAAATLQYALGLSRAVVLIARGHSRKIHLWHISVPVVDWVAVCLLRLLGRRTVITVASPDGPAGWLNRRAWRRICRCADRVVVGARSDVERLAQVTGVKSDRLAAIPPAEPRPTAEGVPGTGDPGLATARAMAELYEAIKLPMPL